MKRPLTASRALLLGVLAFGAITTSAKEASDQTIQSRLDAIFEESDRPDTPGVAVAILKDGVIAHTAFYGMASLEHQVPISASTVFNIGSTSKQFTGLAIAMAIDDGELSLDDDYRAYLPEMPDYGPTIRIEDLLRHTSGIRDWPVPFVMSGRDNFSGLTQYRILEFAKNLRELNFEPGTRSSYSNTNYNLLAEIIERVYETDFDTWMRESIFKPLGMDHTYHRTRLGLVIENRAIGYNQNDEGDYESWLNVGWGDVAAVGSSGIYTTVDDLARWALNFDEAKVGSRKALELMHTTRPLTDGRSNNYGFGLILRKHKGLDIVSHSGGAGGFTAELLRVPDEDLGVIILSNSGSLMPYDHALKVADLFLDAYEDSPSDSLPEIDVPTIQVSEANLAKFKGQYWSNELNGIRTLEVREGEFIYRRPSGEESVLAFIDDACSIMMEYPETRVCFDSTNEGDSGYFDLFSRTAFLERMEKIPDFDPDQLNFEEYVGDYRSDELDITYRIREGKDGLTVSNVFASDYPIVLLFPDHFKVANVVYKFRRDREGAIAEIAVTGGRNWDIRFTKVAED